ncbi:MAG: PaaI family thioesterase [Candidatus Thalassarchaeaceae archaeon]
MDERSEKKPKLSGLAKLMGIELTDFGNGTCKVSAKVLDSHLNAGGVAHGGLHATMLDTALGGALVSMIMKEEWCATAQLDISYINPAYVGANLLANGKVIRRGKNMAHCEGILTDSEGKTIASGKGTWVIWNKKPKSLM